MIDLLNSLISLIMILMIIADIMMSLMSKGKKYRGKVDLLVDGSPCQSFSAIGFREGLKDKRGLLTHNKGET